MLVLFRSNPNWTIYSGWQTFALKNNNLSKQSSAFITRIGRVGQYMLLIIADARSAGHAQKGAGRQPHRALAAVCRWLLEIAVGISATNVAFVA
jgi:hypothetical protein